MSKQPVSVYQFDPAMQFPKRLGAAPRRLTDTAMQHPGIYTVLRTYQHDHALGLERHLARLEESAAMMEMPFQIMDQARLRAAIRHCIHDQGHPDTRLCISISADRPDRIYLALEPFQPPPEVHFRHGVRVYTYPMQRKTPRAKSTEWIALRDEIMHTLPEDAYEGVLVGAGNTLLEGTTSNFYAVMEGNLYTAGQGVLYGTARAGLLEVAPDILPVYLKPVALSDLRRLTEAMLTSSSRGVVPISYIDSRPINRGRPGPITQALIARYARWVESHIRPI